MRSRSWGVPGARAAGGERIMPDVRPGQAAWHQEKRLTLVFEFGTPSRIRTCAHGSGVHSRIQPLPARTPPGLHARGVYGTREIVVLS